MRDITPTTNYEMAGIKSTIPRRFTHNISLQIVLISTVCLLFNMESNNECHYQHTNVDNDDHQNNTTTRHSTVIIKDEMNRNADIRHSHNTSHHNLNNASITGNTSTNTPISLFPPHHLQGHLQPFGESGRKIPATHTSGFPTPQEFFSTNFLPSSSPEPLLMKGAITASPAFVKWTDEYLSKRSVSQANAGLIMTVETTKKESRNQSVLDMELHEFLRAYNDTELYLVTDVPPYLENDLLTPCPLQFLYCAGHQIPPDRTMWMNSGGTHSVVHIDKDDNINCLYRGRKTVVFVDPGELDTGSVIDSKAGLYSNLDVDSVDLNLYPTLQGATFITADMEAGDCLFIPHHWIHQVRSFQSNLAINYWFDHYHTKQIVLHKTTNPMYSNEQCPCTDLFTDNLLQTPLPNHTDIHLDPNNFEWTQDLFILFFQQELHAAYLEDLKTATRHDDRHDNVAKRLRLDTFMSVIQSKLIPSEVDEDTPNLDPLRLAGIFQKNLERMDDNADGFITGEEFSRNQHQVWGRIVQEWLVMLNG